MRGDKGEQTHSSPFSAASSPNLSHSFTDTCSSESPIRPVSPKLLNAPEDLKETKQSPPSPGTHVHEPYQHQGTPVENEDARVLDEEVDKPDGYENHSPRWVKDTTSSQMYDTNDYEYDASATSISKHPRNLPLSIALPAAGTLLPGQLRVPSQHSVTSV